MLYGKVICRTALKTLNRHSAVCKGRFIDLRHRGRNDNCFQLSQILLDGKAVAFANPAQSLHAGIAFIHQELNLINDLPVYENMFIGRELKKKSGFLDHAAMYGKTKELFEKMVINLIGIKLK